MLLKYIIVVPKPIVLNLVHFFHYSTQNIARQIHFLSKNILNGL